VQLPLLTARGQEDGPTIVVLGGVHGDEYEGMAAVRAVFARLDPMVLRGTFLGVPVCNPPAFAAATRESPVDGLNLARIFPGRPDGSVSERIAAALTTRVLANADFLIDLHSSGSRMSMPLLVGYAAGENPAARQSREAALRFGTPVIWGHERVAAGRSLSGPHAAGVPWLYTECPSGGWLHQEIAETYANGVLNVMRHLGMIPGGAAVAAIDHEFVGDGDVDQSLAVPVDGFLTTRVQLLDRVAAGDLLGTVEDARGEVIAEMRAPVDGVVILRRESPAVNAGDIAFLLT
jgi:predicted deacylase